MGSLPNLHELRHRGTSGITSNANPSSDEDTPGGTEFRHTAPIAPNHRIVVNDERLVRNPNLKKVQHNQLCRTRSGPAPNHHLNYDPGLLLDQMRTLSYSPTASRTIRIQHHHRQIRRESINSSIGATSVRRLINTHHQIRPTHNQHNLSPHYTRQILLKNVLTLSTAHALISATFLPLLALQSSASVWMPQWGSYLLTLLYFTSSISALVAPFLIQKLGTSGIFQIGYFTNVIFWGVHLVPIFWAMVPAYVGMGVVMGPVTISRVSFVMNLSTKMSGDDDTRKMCLIRRLARALQGAHDVGLIIGSIVTAALISISTSQVLRDTQEANDTLVYYDDLFDLDDTEQRVCGSMACPSYSNISDSDILVPKKTSSVLTLVYLGLTVLAFMIVCVGLDRIQLFVQQDPLERGVGHAVFGGVRNSFKDSRLQLSALLALFIGVEQGFMYGDFSKFYVMCSMGLPNINLVFLSMGLLQSLAAFTLSMLLRTIQRYIVIGVGIAFQSLLIMVLLLWKPSGDDPALFYVIAAAWGVCNAIWEMLNFTLLTKIYCGSGATSSSSLNYQCAFGNSYFWRYLGLAAAFSVHHVLCTWMQLYLLVLFLLMAVVPYLYLEMKLEHARKLKGITRL